MLTVFPRETWAAAYNGDAVVATRYPIPNSGAGQTGRAVWALVDLPDDRYNVDLSIISTHLPCCRDNEGRRRELDAIARWHTQLRTTGLQTLRYGTPIIVAGDMNFVGDADQVEALLMGTVYDKETFGHTVPLDWDETGLVDAMPYHTTCREAYTWRDDTDVFAPGRLDYIVYSNSVLELRNKFIVCTEEMSLGDLSSANLKVNDTREASDHLPVVADFAIKLAP
jgi:exonuclease III